MNLGGLIQQLDLQIAGRIDPGARVVGVTEDSRRIAPGWVFVARPGLRDDGRRFIPVAIEAGAIAVVTDRSPEGLGDGPPMLVTSEPALVGAVLAERLAGVPSSTLRVIGVTGTNGKTTVATLISRCAGLAGLPCGLIGTVEVDDGLGPRPAEFTTPPAERCSELLAQMRSNGCLAAAMEVSSHSLHQERTAGLGFAAAVFTNLTGDHLDYHGDMECYASAKARLFERLAPDALAVLNADDSGSERMGRACRAPVLWCSAGSARFDVPAALVTVRDPSPSGMALEFKGPWGIIRTTTGLLGVHNAMNLLQTVCVCTGVLGIPPLALAEIIPSLRGPTGRLEPVQDPGDDIRVLVDFAHTDDALANALRAARAATPPGASLWAVFGCGGDKDRSKRPRMGAAAAALADRAIVTSDNPRTEDPEAIIDEVFTGIPGGGLCEVTRQADRREAVREAVSGARPGDVVLIAGKGHEREQILPDGTGGTRSIPFDDFAVAREALVERRESRVSPSAVGGRQS